MKNDEFNNIEIKNEKEGFSHIEFGKTQKAEFTFYNENSDKSRDELNASTNKNNENVKKGKTQTNNNDLVEKAIKASTTATTAASVTTSVAAGVSVVAVVTVSTLVGISVVSNNNASVIFRYLDIYPESISYVVNLYDSNDTTFSLYVENATYLSYNKLQEGANEGYFENLTMGETYRIYVKEETESGKIIYDEKFTTVQKTFSYISGISWDKTANYKTQSFDLLINYSDPEERYSDFKLVLSDGEVSKEYNLTKTDATQTVTINNPNDSALLDIDGKTLTYKYSCLDNGEEYVIDQGSVTFTDNSNAKVEFTDFIIFPEVDILSNEFEFAMSYEDELNYLSNFVLHINDGESDFVYTLQPTIDKQTFVYGESNDGTSDGGPTQTLEDKVFSYYVTYTNHGNEITTETKTVTFTDKENRKSVFNQLVWSKKANFVNSSFDLALDFQDDFDRFDQFKITLTTIVDEDDPTGAPADPVEATFALEKTTENQTVSVLDSDDEPIFDLALNKFTYSLTYLDVEERKTVEAETGTVDFESSLTSTINGIISDFDLYESAGSIDVFTPLRIDMDDQAQVYNSFRLSIDDEEGTQVYLMNDNRWQWVDFALYVDNHESVDELVNGTKNVKIYANIYNPKSGEEEESLVYDENVNFTLGQGNVMKGIRLSQNVIEADGNLSVSLIYVANTVTYTNLKCIFEIGEKRYSYDFEAPSNVFTDVTYIYLSSNESYEEMKALLKENPCNIYLQYDEVGETTETKEILSASNYWFTILD
ncbi:MAG: hypothetical protein K5925_00300 [Bacilli bacterium]|nr:hypothetical protein [Bacilli bacterium]